MSITKIFEYSSEQEHRIRAEGEDIVEVKEVGDYEIMLMKTTDDNHPMIKILGTAYQVGFQRRGRDFTDMDQLLGKEVLDNGGVDIKSFREIAGVIKGWTQRYGEILVASTNKKKNLIYIRIFKNIDFKTKVVYHMRHPFLLIS